MADIMNTAAQLREDLEQSDEFAALKTAYANMQADAAVFQTFKDFQGLQIKLQEAQMKGQQPSEDDMQQAQDLAQKVSQSDLVRQLMDNEKAVNELLNKINGEITKPIQSLYQL